MLHLQPTLTQPAAHHHHHEWQQHQACDFYFQPADSQPSTEGSGHMTSNPDWQQSPASLRSAQAHALLMKDVPLSLHVYTDAAAEPESQPQPTVTPLLPSRSRVGSLVTS